MNLPEIALISLWAGAFATGLAVLLTAPPRLLPAAFLCGFMGRAVRDVSVGMGVDINWATVIASVVVVVVAAAFSRRHGVAPVVLICGVLPLGATVPMFHLIASLMRISTAKGSALTETSLELTASLGKTFTTSLAVAIGLAAGVMLVRLVRRRQDVVA